MSPQNRRIPTDEQNSARMRRYVLAGLFVILVAGLTVTQLFLHQTSVGSSKFVRWSFILYAGTVLVGLALLVLAAVLGRNLIKLFFERRSGQVGSLFKTKLVSISVVLSLLPALLLFFVARGLVNISIEQWFSAPAAQMLENSKSIADQYYEETHKRARHIAERIALSLGADSAGIIEMGPATARKLALLRLDHSLDCLRVFDEHGAELLELGRPVSNVEQKSDVRTLVSLALKGQVGSRVGGIRNDALKEVQWAASPVRSKDGRIAGAILTDTLIVPSVHFKAASVLEGYTAYEQLQKERAKIRTNLILILALATLLIVFAFSWFAMYLAKRITVPIQALAEGAEAVAGGNLDFRVQSEAFDELESLIVSFNRMTADLQENKSRIEAVQEDLRRNSLEMDQRRRYIEAILQSIATGVLSLDSNYCIRTMNRAAYQILQIQETVVGQQLEDVVQGSASETLRALLQKSAVLGPVVRNIELVLPGKRLQLATTVMALLDTAGNQTGWVVVLDDVTELLKMEKLSAWREVARRLAHEIKNPLTPIQLSAERMLRRFKQLMPDRDETPIYLGEWKEAFESYDNLLEECVRTITQEADSLKTLVDEFSRFARLPEVELAEADLNSILSNALSLYNGRMPDVRIEKDFGEDIPALQLDAEQMKRVFINLFDNALEAMADSAGPRTLTVRTRRNQNQRSVKIEISDTGRGFPKEYQDSIFLPYFSTRKGGTGLGLAIVRQIISDHRGYVRAEPNQPLGTTIIIDLPT
jgi:two-component system, NtrC family, nitrogen regulation sensor histidine kinase NtrY